MSKPMWHFRPGSAEYTADDAGVRALAGLAAPDIFFREALQNSIDEAKPGHPASVRISLIALSGKERTRFLKAFGWDEFRKQLALQGVAGEQPPGRRRAPPRRAEAAMHLRHRARHRRAASARPSSAHHSRRRVGVAPRQAPATCRGPVAWPVCADVPRKDEPEART